MIFLPLLAAAVLAQDLPSDPLAPVQYGQVQCYSPDAATKTCNSIARYTPNSGGYTNTATILLSSRPAVTMTTSTQVQVRDGAVCGTLRDEDIEAAKVKVDGRGLSSGEASLVVSAVADAVNDYVGQEICTTYVAAGDGLTAKASVQGTPQPELDQPVIWVSPSDGYKVAP
ncbi:hypothetical protein ABAC460_12265 [Asticcacaulis sp. AC460]|uniref:hypothetical protein n=1 Tax=Asticcacaulis sp. AC460 TaxID=1282360 RepID=UPI0003C3B27D|nr:hypothetical protein [Asticcacaulis sp. AC460]ESQ89637.1 hypothetical protein ABAC460_12265 [Asticcacaulis sp. AC460]